MHLDQAEFLITLVLENLGKESYLMVVAQVSLHGIDNGGSPFDDQRLQAVFLVQVGVHVLFHSFFRGA